MATSYFVQLRGGAYVAAVIGWEEDSQLNSCAAKCRVKLVIVFLNEALWEQGRENGADWASNPLDWFVMGVETIWDRQSPSVHFFLIYSSSSGFPLASHLLLESLCVSSTAPSFFVVVIIKINPPDNCNCSNSSTPGLPVLTCMYSAIHSKPDIGRSPHGFINKLRHTYTKPVPNEQVWMYKQYIYPCNLSKGCRL